MGRVAGIDWAKGEHQVLVADEGGLELFKDTIAHEEQVIERLCSTLQRLGVERVAVERPDGLLIERLLDAGLLVFAIHPNQVKAARARFRAGGRSDRCDAFVLSELARTDSHRFRTLTPDSDETKALRALSRAREDPAQARVALDNQLRAELEAFWPGAVRLFSEIDSPIALQFLERYPTPVDARGLGEKRLAAFLARNGYCGRRSPGELIERLRSPPQGRSGEAETEARRQVTLSLVQALRPLVERISVLTAEIAHAVRTHPDGEVLPLALPRPQVGRHRVQAPRRDRRLPRALPERRGACRRRRHVPRRRRVRQAQGRRLPLRLRQAAARLLRHARRLHQALAPLGQAPLRGRPRPRPRPSPGGADRGPRLVPGDLA